MITKQKQIEREKIIEAAATLYAIKMCKDRVPDQYNISAHDLIELSFIAGAKVADKCPRPGLVKIEDVEDIYCEWLKYNSENSTFLEYFANYCEEEGWL